MCNIANSEMANSLRIEPLLGLLVKYWTIPCATGDWVALYSPSTMFR